MKTFEQAGEAMLLAQEGNAQIARAILTVLKKWAEPLREWLSNMPVTLPPTESFRR